MCTRPFFFLPRAKRARLFTREKEGLGTRLTDECDGGDGDVTDECDESDGNEDSMSTFDSDSASDAEQDPASSGRDISIGNYNKTVRN